MAEKIKFTIEVDDKGSVKVIDQLNDSMKDTKKAADTAEKAVGDVSKSVEKGEGTFKKFGATIKGGLGIGLVIGALDSLRNGLMENQKVADIFSKGMIILQGVINGVVEVLEPLFNGLMKAFTDPKQAWDDLVASFETGAKWIKENLIDLVGNKFIEWANNARIQILELRKTWNEFTGDTEEAAQIQEKINELQKENGKIQDENALKINNVKQVINDVKDAAVESFNTIAKSTKNAFDNSDAILNAERNIARLQIAFQGIIEKYDQQAEKQRQIRDDETKTISERIAANEKLAKILQEGQEKEIENLDEQIAQQRILLSNNKGNIEIENEILALQAEKTAVEAKYTGLKSEQLTNINALEKEAIELKRAEAEGTIEANAIISQSEADRLADSLEGFDARKKAIDEEYKSRSELLATEISQLKEGTQAYVDAVNEKKVLDAQYAADVRANETELAQFKKDKAQEEKELAQSVAQAKVDALMSGIQGVQELVSADSEYGKALAIAQAVINTYQGASKALGQGGVFGPIAAAGVIASGLAQVRSIMQTELPESPMGGGGGGSSVSMPSGPSVGIVSGQMNQTNQLQAQLNSQMAKPTRAYVVGQNVTSQQSLDRHILQNATL